MSKKHFASGGIIVKNISGRLMVLLIKDKYGRWTWPKGHIEGSETPEEAALREIGEETSQRNIRILEKVGEQKYSYMLGEEEVSKTVYIYLIESLEEEEIVIQEEEIVSAEWVEGIKALEIIGYESSAELLSKGLKVYKEKYL